MLRVTGQWDGMLGERSGDRHALWEKDKPGRGDVGLALKVEPWYTEPAEAG